MTDEELAAIKKRVDGATRGPWEWRDGRYAVKHQLWPVHELREEVPVVEGLVVDPDDPRRRQTMPGYVLAPEGEGYEVDGADIDAGEPDFEFIAHSWQDVKDLIAEVERLRAELEGCKDGSSY